MRDVSIWFVRTVVHGAVGKSSSIIFMFAYTTSFGCAYLTPNDSRSREDRRRLIRPARRRLYECEPGVNGNMLSVSAIAGVDIPKARLTRRPGNVSMFTSGNTDVLSLGWPAEYRGPEIAQLMAHRLAVITVSRKSLINPKQLNDLLFKHRHQVQLTYYP